MQAVNASPELWAVIHKWCPDEPGKVHTAVSWAVMDWLYRGGKSEQERMTKQAQTLRAAMDVLAEYREIVEHNMAGRVVHDPQTGKHLTLAPWLIPDSPVGAGPVLNMVASVALQLADDLENRNPEGIKDRKDSDFYRVLGRRFSKVGLARPPVETLRAIFNAFNAATELVLTDDGDDSSVIHAYDRGVVMSEKK